MKSVLFAIAVIAAFAANTAMAQNLIRTCQGVYKHTKIAGHIGDECQFQMFGKKGMTLFREIDRVCHEQPTCTLRAVVTKVGPVWDIDKVIGAR
jgi:hypothetical protein